MVGLGKLYINITLAGFYAFKVIIASVSMINIFRVSVTTHRSNRTVFKFDQTSPF